MTTQTTSPKTESAVVASPLAELAERVEKLTGPSRAIDALIAEALGWSRVPNPTSAGGLVGRWMRADGSMTGHEGPPSWTADLNALLSLVSEKLPGAAKALSSTQLHDGEWWSARIAVRSDLWFVSNDCPTPALALLSATLRALAAKGGA